MRLTESGRGRRGWPHPGAEWRGSRSRALVAALIEERAFLSSVAAVSALVRASGARDSLCADLPHAPERRPEPALANTSAALARAKVLPSLLARTCVPGCVRGGPGGAGSPAPCPARTSQHRCRVRGMSERRPRADPVRSGSPPSGAHPSGAHPAGAVPQGPVSQGPSRRSPCRSPARPHFCSDISEKSPGRAMERPQGLGAGGQSFPPDENVGSDCADTGLAAPSGHTRGLQVMCTCTSVCHCCKSPAEAPTSSGQSSHLPRTREI